MGTWSVKGGVRYAHAPGWALERVIALRVHLSDSDAGNGPLRVIPKTYTLGVLTDAEVHDRVRGSVTVECLSETGGVIAMRPLGAC